MKSMPIASRIISSKKVGITHRPVVDPVEAARLIREDAAHFDVNVASDLYWQGGQNHYRLSSDFGPLRLPFPVTWMEWAVPAEVSLDGKRVKVQPHYAGCLLAEQKRGQKYAIQAVCFVAVNDDPPLISPIRLAFNVDADGRYLGGDMGVGCRYDADALDAIGVNNYRSDDMSKLYVACLALNLINCKNVTTQAAGCIPVRRSGAQKRRREPGIEYRTIRLPGAPCGGEATGENEGIMPLHRVRGHFKTFTPDAPLLGKHTGTYWWGWQVRGKKANGEIISDYELKDAS